MMLVSNEFNLGETVYLRTDPRMTPWLIVGFYVYPLGMTYQISCGLRSLTVFEMELTRERDTLKALGVEVEG